MRFFALATAATVIGSVTAAPILEFRDNLDFNDAHEILSRSELTTRGIKGVVSWLCDLPHIDEVCQKTSNIIDKWLENAQNTVATPQGKISGFKTANTYRYTVPYAKSPTGALRFQPPSSVINWSGTVWVPASANSYSKLPVFVWLHGGSFVTGSASDSALDGSELAAKGNMIVVTVQYRLGLFGFLRAPELGIQGNMGLLDTVEALNYIKKNIASFGGNPAAVTLAGQSSGASLIKSLFSTPRADSLFQRAILHSAPLNYGDHTTATSNDVGQTFLGNLKCTTLACLQSATVPSILSAQDNTFFTVPATVPGVSASEPIRPVIDGSIVTQAFFQYTNNANLGNRNRQVIFTTVKDEAGPTIASVSQGQMLAVDYYPIFVQALMDADRAGKVLGSGLYKPDPANADATRDQLELLGTDWVWRCANQQAALNMSSHGVSGRVWLAEFDAGIPYPSNQGIAFCKGRVCHQDDIEAVFNTGEQLTTAQTKLGNEVLSRWSAFAKTGNPNAAGYPQWSAIQADAGVNLNMLVFNGALSSVVQFQRKEQCGPNGFWGQKALFDEQLFTP